MKITDEELADILIEASHRLLSEIKYAHKTGSLEFYLKKIGMEELLDKIFRDGKFESNPEGKILVVGGSHISDGEIYSCFRKFRIDKERIELLLDYEKIKKFDFKKLQHNPKYRLLFFGPTPHSGIGKEDSSSIMINLETKDGYPKTVRLTDGHNLKITKASLLRAIEEQIRTGYIK
jgi:hypothetical protein